MFLDKKCEFSFSFLNLAFNVSESVKYWCKRINLEKINFPKKYFFASPYIAIPPNQVCIFIYFFFLGGGDYSNGNNSSKVKDSFLLMFR